jgi:predicted nucleotidyltransferase component of viral defense system
MRTALEERLNRLSKEKGIELMRLRRHVAFDRILARFFKNKPEGMILKGGYAIELWIQNARTTMDIDISFNGDMIENWNGRHLNDPAALQELLQDYATRDTGDFFQFIIGNSTLDLENAPYGGYRFPIEARMAGRLFIKFEIDIAAGDVWIEPHEEVQPANWLGFAGVEPPVIPLISKEQQFAEKIHAYTLPRKTQNSRVKDLVDMLILIRSGNMDPEKIRVAVSTTFQKRNTHPLPSELPPPPDFWKGPFKKLAGLSEIDAGLQDGFELVREFCRGKKILRL